MASKLQCEICGGKLVGKPGGIFECESCGTEYSTEWAKAKIQEISGTVKVEGTVEVTGKVQVEGGTVQVDTSANKDALLKRAFMMLEERNWAKADELLEQVLNIDPECGEAYLGKLMARKKVAKRGDLRFVSLPINERSEWYYGYAKELIRYATPELKQFIDEINKPIIERMEKEEREEQEKEQQETYAKTYAKAEVLSKKDNSKCLFEAADIFQSISIYKDASQRAEHCSELAKMKKDRLDLLLSKDLRRIARIAGNMIVSTDRAVYGLNADGTVVVAGGKDELKDSVSGWHNIVAITASKFHMVGLKSDGTVVAVGSNFHGECEVFEWKDIIAIAADSHLTIGLKADGTVVAAGKKDDKIQAQFNVSDWKHITAISAGSYHTIGLKSDGTVVARMITGEKPLVFNGEKLNFDCGQCSVSDWTDIVAIATSGLRTVGLKSDGTVVAVGNDCQGVCNVSEWRDVTEIAADDDATYGLTKDGTLLVAGKYSVNPAWKQVVSFSTKAGFKVHVLVALKSDTTVVGENNGHSIKEGGISDWEGIISVTVGKYFTYGLREDGKVVVTEKNKYGYDPKNGIDHVSEWKLFDSIEELEERYRRIQNARITLIQKCIAERQTRLNEERNELANLKGLFAGKRRLKLEKQIDDDADAIAFMQEQLRKQQ